MRSQRYFQKALCFLALLAVVTSYAQSYSQDGKQKEILTNETIFDLVKSGFGDELIIETIRHADHDFDTSLNGLKKLKEAGVSDAVIKAMITESSGSSTIEASTPADDPNDPMSPHEPGIYFMMNKDGMNKFMQLEPTVYSQGKSGGWIESQLTYGLAKTKFKAVVQRPKARTRLSNARPTFYFYFEQKTSGLSNSGSFIAGATSPNEFVLVKMEEKKDRRELTVSEANVFGSSTGTRSQDTKDFDFEKISPGVYHVMIPSDLEPGEYCFFYAGTVAPVGVAGGASTKLFDFGIEPVAELPIVSEPEEKLAIQNSDAPRAKSKEAELRAKVLEIKKTYMIINLGKSSGLTAGMEFMVTVDEYNSRPGKFYLMEVVELEDRYAIVKIKEAREATAFSEGDNVIVKFAQQAANR